MAAAKQRWRLLAKACRSSSRDCAPFTDSAEQAQNVSRVGGGSFGFVTSEVISVNPSADEGVDTDQAERGVGVSAQYHVVSYSVANSGGNLTKLILRQRKAGSISLADHRLTQACGVDSTGLVCLWPAEEAMTHYCVRHPELFRGKRVLELGAGYGLAGLASAACTQAKEVVLTDGNSEVIDALQHNVSVNSHLFGGTSVTARLLRWGDVASLQAAGGPYDVIVAADCTFFKEYHTELAATIKSLLIPAAPSAASQSAECPENAEPVGRTPSEHDLSVTSCEFFHPRDSAVSGLSNVNRGSHAGRLGTEDFELDQQLGTEYLDCDQRGDTCTEERGQISTQDRASTDDATTAFGKVDLRQADALQVAGGSIGRDTERCALLFNPQRGGTLNTFVEIARQMGLRADLSRSFDPDVDRRNGELKSASSTEWPGYTEEHCLPFMLTLTLEELSQVRSAQVDSAQEPGSEHR